MTSYNLKIMEIEKELEDTDHYLDFKTEQVKIEKILKLRDQKNVLILGHNYMKPLIYHLSDKDSRGDSLALSMYAAKSTSPIILFDGVRFMAETAKILNPDKKVLIADLNAGCSLADPFRKQDVLEYKEKFPGAPVVTYINSYAEVKAESDYCCTSANALKVVNHASKDFNSNKVIFLPDSLMGKNLENELGNLESKIELIYPGKYDNKFGRCEVHEKISAEEIRRIRRQFDLKKGSSDSAVLVHLECPPEVLAEADYYGSTSGMAKYLLEHPNLKKVYLGTECEMTSNLQNEFPQIDFVRACQVFCQHMRKITLDKILFSLENEVYEINVEENIRRKAKTSIDRMLSIGR